VFISEALFASGYTDLVSVIPPGAQLAPTSKIEGSQVGKVPGKRLSSGLWVGYNWRVHVPTLEDAKRWGLDAANIGMRADRFPAIDIDSTDPTLSQIIHEFVVGKLGPAPVRIGKPPKKLLVYRTNEPFGRMRLWIEKGEQRHLVEVLGMGQQYLVHGTHPSTLRPYEWETPLGAPDELTLITREQADDFITALADYLDMLGHWKLSREGDGKPLVRNDIVQDGLMAPSMEALEEAVEQIPNTNDLYPDRTSYLKIGYAIRAAAGPNESEGFDIFARWAAKWEGNGFVKGNDPEVVLADWRRMKPPFQVGWAYLAEIARSFGYSDASDAFEPISDAPSDVLTGAVTYSDQWLAEKVVEARRSELRYLPEQGKFLVWDSGFWRPDAVSLAEDVVKQELKKIARTVEGRGVTPQEQKMFQQMAVTMCSAHKATAVKTLIQSDRGIAVATSALDHDPWMLNTPSGIVDLTTGKLLPPDPDQLCTKTTAVPPDFNGGAPLWRAFLEEVTAGNTELVRFLQKFAGYALTGVTREQNFMFIWGPGGNGKSVFMNVLTGILNDYARIATMETFTASNSDRHTTDLAMMHDARLVVASETQAGKRWDEARVKRLTGGEPVTARFMRQDNFTFEPKFKLVFVGNHKPEIRNLDDALKRRTQLVPFTVAPKVIDRQLADKLKREWPAILAWMIEGCLLWQAEGLTPPDIIRASTQEYFDEEDAIGRWLQEATVADNEAATTTAELYSAWREWANENGEFPGTVRSFSGGLIARKLARWREPATRRMGFSGIRLKPNDNQLGVI
jgi:P4 family phage/plasmid primase-like protien